MKYIYTEKDLDLISWERIDGFIDKIYKDVDKYLKENNLKDKKIDINDEFYKIQIKLHLWDRNIANI